MAGTRVPVLAPDPETGRLRFATVDESEADIVIKAGGKRLTKAEGDTREAEMRQAEREEKAGVAGKVNTVIGAYMGAVNPLMYQGGPGSTGEAYNRGVTSGLTAGLSDVAARKALDATAGPGAGAKFAQQLDDVKTTSPYAHGAGEMMGLVGGTALGASTPAGAIGRIGGLAEGGAGALTKGLAARGALGKAAATGIGMGVRGATEAAIYSGATSATDDLVHDHEVNGEKLYTAIGHGALAGGTIGGGLGFTGSLAASGARAAGRGIISRLARGAEEVTPGIEATETRAGKLLGAGDRAVAPAAAEAVAKEVPLATRAEAAARKTASGLAFDSLGTTRRVSDAINAEVPGGTEAVGDWVNRNIRKGQSTAEVASTSRVDEFLPAIEGKVSQIGKAIGEETSRYNVRVHVDEIVKPAAEIMDAMSKDPTRIQGVEAFKQRVAQMGQAFDNANLIQADGTISLSDMYAQRARMERVAYELGRGSAAEQGFRQYLREVDSRLVSKLDEAARAAGQDGSQIRHLKREYQLGARALEAAQDGVNRIQGNNIFGIREGIGGLAGIATGHPVLGIAAAIGGKVAKQRGAAIGAHILSSAADSGFVARAVRSVDEIIGASAKGVIADLPPAAKASGKAPKKTAHTVEASQAETVALRSQADAIMQWQGQIRANPKRIMDALAEAAEVVGRTAGPRTASAYTSASLRAINYISRYVPVKDRRDPLDPRSVPPLTYDEADRLVRAHKYATEPGAVWKDFGRGVITPEGLDWANEVPEQFAEFRTELLAHVTEHMLKNRELSPGQRLRIDKLLGTPAGPDLRPDAIARHQEDFLEKVPDDASGPQPPQTGGQPVNMKISQAGFDAVEQRKAQ